MGYIQLANIIKPHGLKGTLRCFSLTDFPEERFKKGQELSLFDPKTDNRIQVHVSSFRETNGLLYLDFDEIKSIDEAETLKGFEIQIDEEKAPMPEGYYRLGLLIGCQAIDSKTKEALGEIVDILEYAPTKTLRIKRNKGKDFFVPLNDFFVGEKDFDKRIVEINVVEGML